MGSQRELEIIWPATGRIRDVCEALLAGADASQVLVTLQAVQDTLQERVDGIIEVADARGEAAGVRWARGLQDATRESRQRRRGRSRRYEQMAQEQDKHMWKAAGRQAGQRHFRELFGKASWTPKGAQPRAAAPEPQTPRRGGGRGGGGRGGRRGQG